MEKLISELYPNIKVRSFIAKIRRRETQKYLTKDIHQFLGKAERPTFNKKFNDQSKDVGSSESKR